MVPPSSVASSKGGEWSGVVCLGGVCLGRVCVQGVSAWGLCVQGECTPPEADTPCQLHAGVHPAPGEQNDRQV